MWVGEYLSRLRTTRHTQLELGQLVPILHPTDRSRCDFRKGGGEGGRKGQGRRAKGEAGNKKRTYFIIRLHCRSRERNFILLKSKKKNCNELIYK